MIDEIYAYSARCAEWTLRRNPMYLMSAVLMAVGARLFLVGPTNAPGDIKLILVTLGALQVYEWAVGGILVLLHRYRRSLEDQPSLLLVAILFWTGPMAATIEMTVLRKDIGVVLAAGVCLIAIGELGFVERALKIRMTFAARLAGSACVLFLAAAPPLLRVPEGGAGPNELWLYVAWWVLAGITLTSLGSFRANRTPKSELRTGRTMVALSSEIAFLTLALGTTALHLVGMNHAFLCHAAWFYASLLLVAATIVVVEYLIQTGRRRHPALPVVSVLPLVAILLATQPFDADVPVATLPFWLRDPMLPTSLIAAGAWWLGYLRHRAAPALHAGSASFALAAFRAISTFLSHDAGIANLGVGGIASRDVIAFAFFGAAGYFAVSAWIRRCRPEAFLALLANLAAVSLLAWQRVPADWAFILLAVGWSWLMGTHLALRRPSILLRVLPIGFLLMFTCAYDFSPALAWYARAHGLVLIGVLLCAGFLWRWTAYQWVACASGTAYAWFLLWRWAGDRGEPVAAAVITCSFAMLFVGAIVSWHKKRLLDWTCRSREDEAGGQIET